MNPTLKTLACALVHKSGLLGMGMRWTESRPAARQENRFQILTYHRVGEETDPFTSAVSATVFARHMRVLRKHFTPMSMTDVLKAAEDRAVPPLAVAVTFDDGYQDVFRHAFPTLQRYGIPATVYLASGLIGESVGMWNDRVGIAIRDTTRLEVSGVPGVAKPLPLRNVAERCSALQTTVAALKRAPGEEREEAATRIAESLGVAADRGPAMLRWEEVREMHDQGVEFGAHTVNHPILSSLVTEDAAREISRSKRQVEEQIQEPVRHFAYPNGTTADFDETTMELVCGAGFTSAVSTIFGVNDSATDRYALRRGGPWEEDSSTFAAKMWWYRHQPV